MDSQTLMIKTHSQKLFSMFHLRTSLAVLLCAVLALVTCKRCSVNEVPKLEIETCRSYRGNFDSSYPDVLSSDVSSELASRNSVQQHNLEIVCPPSNSLCFPSTLNGLLSNEIDTGSEALDDSGVQSNDFSARLKQARSNLSWSPEHGIFMLLGGRIISCSLQQQDGFHELPSNDIYARNGQQADVSSCIRPLLDHKIRISKSGKKVEAVKSGFLDDLSVPPVEIKPSLLDWGHRNMYDPSLGFVTVKNLNDHRILSVYDPYSSNSQFYPCNFSETLLAPGEIASICFVFFPTQLGLSSAQLVLQTSFGGFLIHAKGYAVESPYLIKPLSGLDVSSGGRWRKNLSLFNPFNEVLYVEEITAWISISSGNISRSSKAICSIQTMEDSSDYNMLSAKDWLDIESGEVGLPQILMRPQMNWEVGPQKTENIMELDFSCHFEGKITGAFCLLLKPSKNKIDTVMVPLEAELSPYSPQDAGHVSASLEALVPCDASESIIFALSVRNDSPHLLNVIKVSEVGGGTETFEIKYIEGLILFPSSITQVAVLNYARVGTPEVDMHCKLLILINDTRSSQIEIPCIDLISICSGKKLDSSVGYTQGINNVVYMNGRQKSFSSSMQPPSEIKAMDNSEADEFVLRNWKSQATARFMSVLDDSELLFPTIHVGNHCSKWIAVKNPSQDPVVMQLILNSGEVIDKCRTPELLLQPSTSSILLGNKSIAPTRYGFSLGKDAITEAFIHPYGSAYFGPILFQPSNRCEWRSSALFRNNLTGVEWLSLRGFGGSLSLVLLEGSGPVESLEFKLKLPTQLNFSSPDMLHSMEGKSCSCYEPLTKEVYAKNTGDLPLEVIRIEVSGAECGLDGFRVHNCKGFSLQPGESVRLQISYLTDFSSATIQRDLELALATGILVIPMKASLPIYALNFCKRSMFWMRLKKAMIVILFAASLLFLLVCLFFPRIAAFTSQDIKSGKNSSNVNFLGRSVEEEEVLVLESAGRCSDGYTSGHGLVNSCAGYLGKADSRLDAQPKTRLTSSVLSKSSSVLNSDGQDASDSRSLRVIIGKEKGRRRKKKKSYGTGLFEVSSSQSGNSTPSSPLSPVACLTPKRGRPVSPDVEQSAENRNPFAQAPDQKHDNSKCTEPSSKLNHQDNDVSSNRGKNNWGLPAQEKTSLPKKVIGKAVLLTSASFPSAVRAGPAWTCHSPYLASTSTIAPHARAPGSKLHNQKAGDVGGKTGLEIKTCLQEKAGVKEKFTYDIWGDHLFGLSLTYESREVSSKSTPAIENNSDSFFVRGPPTLITNSLPYPVSSDMEGNK